MPRWLKRLAISAVVGVPLGAGVAIGVGWYCLATVDEGREPIAGQLHVREGRCWTFASDRATGLAFYNLERELYPLRNGPLDEPAVPWWAEPDLALGPPEPAKWRVGTLAVGWPWQAVAKQWNETELDTGFLPPVERDDDGSTIRRAAERFTTRVAGSRVFSLPLGLAADLALFGLAGTALVAFVIGQVRRDDED
jgi:hypothetical protein